MKHHFVYKITDRENSGVYFGVTANPEVRWKQHRGISPYEQKPLYAAMRYIGEGAFSLDVLAKFCERSDALKMERTLIIEALISGAVVWNVATGPGRLSHLGRDAERIRREIDMAGSEEIWCSKIGIGRKEFLSFSYDLIPMPEKLRAHLGPSVVGDDRTDQYVSMMRKLAGEGLSVSQIASRVGMPIASVGKLMRRNGIKFHHGGNKLSYEDRKKLQDWAAKKASGEAGESYSTMSKLTGLSKQRICQIVQQISIDTHVSDAKVSVR